MLYSAIQWYTIELFSNCELQCSPITEYISQDSFSFACVMHMYCIHVLVMLSRTKASMALSNSISLLVFILLF